MGRPAPVGLGFGGVGAGRASCSGRPLTAETVTPISLTGPEASPSVPSLSTIPPTSVGVLGFDKVDIPLFLILLKDSLRF